MEIIKKNKLFIILYSILIIIGLIVIIFSFNNYKYYDEDIAKIVSVNDEYVSTNTVSFGYEDKKYSQEIEAILLNGEYKDEKIIINNNYYKGETHGQRYNVSDEVFVSLNIRDDKIVNSHIEGYKRDKYIVILLVSFVLVIVLVGKLKGFLSFISLLINIVLFCVIAFLDGRYFNLIFYSFIGSIIFSIICLSLVSGFNKKTLAAIISTICGISLVTLIAYVVIYFTKYEGVRVEQMELLTRPFQNVLMAEIILGGLGAIMDVSISIASSMEELINKNNRISIKNLKRSCKNIGRDIMGTMINVLFFTYICSGIANLVIYFRNGIELKHLIHEYISLELARALTGAIGITISIPIAIYVSLFIFKRRIK